MDGTTILDLIFFYFSVLCSLSYSSAIELKTLWKIVVWNCRVPNCRVSKKISSCCFSPYDHYSSTLGEIYLGDSDTWNDNWVPFWAKERGYSGTLYQNWNKGLINARDIISHRLFEERTSFHTCSSVKLAFVIQEIPSYSHCQTKFNGSAYKRLVCLITRHPYTLETPVFVVHLSPRNFPIVPIL